MSFKKKKYIIIKQALSPEMTDFAYKYLLFKRQVAQTLFNERYISPYEEMFGHWNDTQVPNTYSNYGDMVWKQYLLNYFL